MKLKKGQSLSLTTIVIAVLVLVVLVVLILIVTGRLRETGEGIKSVEQQYRSEKCAIPGTLRTCTTLLRCNARGGINYELTDCASPEICCSS